MIGKISKEHEEGMRELSNRLRKHDWFHEMSDDGNVWRAGNNDWKEIKSMADKLGRDGARLLKAHRDTRYHPGLGFSYYYPEDKVNDDKRTN